MTIMCAISQRNMNTVCVCTHNPATLPNKKFKYLEKIATVCGFGGPTCHWYTYVWPEIFEFVVMVYLRHASKLKSAIHHIQGGSLFHVVMP